MEATKEELREYKKKLLEYGTKHHEELMKKIRQYPMTKEECYPPSPDRIDQPEINADVQKPVYIEYYAHGKMVGHNMIPKGSNQADRETYAKNVNIEFFDEFRLDKDRVVAKFTNETGFVDDYGKLWIVENKP